MANRTYGALTVDVDDSTQYATVYQADTGQPVGTLERRRVLDRASPEWTVYATDGTRVRGSRFVGPCVMALARYLKSDDEVADHWFKERAARRFTHDIVERAKATPAMTAERVQETGRQFGQKIGKSEARRIAALLR